VPGIAGDEERIVTILIGIDDVPAAGFDPRPEVGAFEAMGRAG
jgi:hypothetical protein